MTPAPPFHPRRTPRLRRALALFLYGVAGVCITLILVDVFTDGIAVDVGPRTLELGRLNAPLYVLTGLAVLAMLANPRSVLHTFRALARAEPDARTRRLEGAVLAALIGGGFVLRIARVHEYAFSLDEAQFVWASSHESFRDVLRHVFASSPHPPGYFVFLHLLLRISRALWWLRLPSVLAGTFLIWVSHRLGRDLYGRAAGLTMAAMVAFSPALVDLSRVSRNYMMGLALLTLALWLFVRFLRDARWRDFAWYVAAQGAAVLWAYPFMIVVPATSLTLVAAFLARREPPRRWLGAMLGQLPLFAMMAALYVHHVSKLPATVVVFHEALYRGRLGMDWARPLRPLVDTWAYLTVDDMAGALLCLSVAGLVGLLLCGAWLEALLSTSPLVLAYAAMAVGRLPLGGSRHSTYLFPFLFGLVASLAGAAGRGYGRLARRPGRLTGVWVVLGLGCVIAYVDLSLLDYGRDVQFVPQAGRPRELPTYYRQADLDRALALLREHAGPDDVVMMSVQTLFTLRVQLGMSPLLDPTDEQQARGDFRWAHPRGPLQHRLGDVRFYMAPGRFAFTPESLVRGVREVSDRFGLAPPRRVWLLRSPWETSLASEMRHAHPGVRFDAAVDQQTDGILFVADWGQLQAISRP